MAGIAGVVFPWAPASPISPYIAPEAADHMRRGGKKLARDSGWFSVGGVPLRVVVVDPHSARGVSRARLRRWKGVARRAAEAVHAVLSPTDARPARVDATIYLWRGEKRLGPASDPISPSHANTGVTSLDPDTGEASILVYREEEAVKTLVHEMLHAHRLGEWANRDGELIRRCRCIERREGVRVTRPGGLLPAEAIVDALAVWLVSRVFGGRTWRECVEHAESLSRRLTSRCVRDFGGEWRQTTSAFEYYCVKPYFMRAIGRLLEAHGAGLQTPRRESVRGILPGGAGPRGGRADGLVDRVYRRSTVGMRMTPPGLADPP
jgi:hypothetical protein